MPVVSDLAEEVARGYAVETSAVISPTLFNALASVDEYGSDSDYDDMPDLMYRASIKA